MHTIQLYCKKPEQLFSIFETNKITYMAFSHKDWELPNSWIWLAEMDIDRCLDFPI